MTEKPDFFIPTNPIFKCGTQGLLSNFTLPRKQLWIITTHPFLSRFEWINMHWKTLSEENIIQTNPPRTRSRASLKLMLKMTIFQHKIYIFRRQKSLTKYIWFTCMLYPLRWRKKNKTSYLAGKILNRQTSHNFDQQRKT